MGLQIEVYLGGVWGWGYNVFNFSGVFYSYICSVNFRGWKILELCDLLIQLIFLKGGVIILVFKEIFFFNLDLGLSENKIRKDQELGIFKGVGK